MIHLGTNVQYVAPIEMQIRSDVCGISDLVCISQELWCTLYKDKNVPTNYTGDQNVMTKKNVSFYFLPPRTPGWPPKNRDHKHFANSRPSASNLNFFLDHSRTFFLTAGQNNFGYKIQFLSMDANFIFLQFSPFVTIDFDCRLLVFLFFFWRKRFSLKNAQYRLGLDTIQKPFSFGMQLFFSTFFLMKIICISDYTYYKS